MHMRWRGLGGGVVLGLVAAQAATHAHQQTSGRSATPPAASGKSHSGLCDGQASSARAATAQHAVTATASPLAQARIT